MSVCVDMTVINPYLTAYFEDKEKCSIEEDVLIETPAVSSWDHPTRKTLNAIETALGSTTKKKIKTEKNQTKKNQETRKKSMNVKNELRLTSV